MNSSHPDYPGAPDELASYWAARLDGSVLSAADQNELNAWLAKDPSHRTLLSHYCQFSADLELLLPTLATHGAIELPQEISPKQRARRLPWLAAGLAAAAAITAVGLTLGPGRHRSQMERVATPVAQRQSLTLADGTRAELNAQTSLQIEIGPIERRVRLASGEAFFTVTKDPARPFIVETPSGSVRVTGTVFDVRTETTSTLEVLVVEGSVQVRPEENGPGLPGAPIALRAGDKLSNGSRGFTVTGLSASAIDDAMAWRQGQVVFHGVPLSDALARFAHYHGRGISADPAVANLSVGGRFSLDDLDGFLSALESFLPVRVSRGLSGTIQISPANSHAPTSTPSGPSR